MSLSVFEMHFVELFCQRPPGACYVICDKWHYKACLGKAADFQKATAETREFLDIAGLSHRKWEEDRKLVRRIQKSGWLFFHTVRDRNPDTDGWWIITALLEEVRRGNLLAIKGPRNGLFPSPYSSTPLRNPVARTGSNPDGESVLSVQYDPATWQTRLNAARAARTRDRAASALLGDAQPLHFQPHSADGDTFEVAGIPNMTGNPNSWIESGPGMKRQWRMFDSNGSAAVDIDFDSHHGQPNPHAHNWDGNVRDQGWPVSILP
ncbi:hypothetical protein OKW34_002866 [Paraburkholderia youngii]|uniref:hypothetical protein n=1 Tax=Paraburkholderia youngii TaxID=2782701 RepID=UPI003D25856F